MFFYGNDTKITKNILVENVIAQDRIRKRSYYVWKISRLTKSFTAEQVAKTSPYNRNTEDVEL